MLVFGLGRGNERDFTRRAYWIGYSCICVYSGDFMSEVITVTLVLMAIVFVGTSAIAIVFIAVAVLISAILDVLYKKGIL